MTYQTIAAELRDRIRTGRLAPGDRVPSTRQITRQWGVAVATATKALRALQAEGLVTGIVGVGTVVADRPQTRNRSYPAGGGDRGGGSGLGPRLGLGIGATGGGPGTSPQGTDRAKGRRHSPRLPEVELTRDRIVRTAVVIADDEGLAAVTMRRLAVELDVAVMSLYRHVASKDELLLLMVDHVMGQVRLPDPLPAGWRSRLEAMARLLWAVMKQHPWMGSGMSMTRPLLVPNGMAHTDRSLGLLRELGFEPDVALEIHLAMVGLVLGVGMSLQTDVEAERETGQSYDEWMDQSDQVLEQLGVGERFPHLAAVHNPPDLDRVFDTGLTLMLDGLARRLPARVRRTG